MEKKKNGFIKEHLLPAIVCIGLALTLSSMTWYQPLRFGALDQLTRLRTYFQAPPDKQLLTVGIDDESIDYYGQWPWSRQRHGQFMYALSFVKPAVVAWDLLFTEKSTQSDDDALLQAGAGELKGRAVFGAFSSDEDPNAHLQPADYNWHAPQNPKLNPPLPNITGDVSQIPSAAFALWPIGPLQEVGRTAFVDTPAQPDGVRRYVPMLQAVKDRVYPSLSLQTLLVYWQIPPDQVRVVLGDAIYIDGATIKRRIPIDGHGRYFVNYRFGGKSANEMGYFKLGNPLVAEYLGNKKQPSLPDVTGKILLVGQFSTGLSDNGKTPFDAETPLVLVHANVIDNILQEDYARRLPMWPVLVGVFGLSIFGLVYFPKRSLVQQALFALGVPALYLAAAAWLWIEHSLWLPLLWPVLGFGSLQIFMIARQLVREQRAKKQIKGMFGTYLSPTLVNRMIESGQSPQLGGHKEEITAYFSDIQSFSTFSELIPPDQLVELMNEYLSACTDILQEESGTLDKYIGDAIVTIFGAPLPLPDHALRACIASQRIQIKLAELREKWRSEGDKWPEIVTKMQSRIGLNSGETIVGNIGSRTRFNYTMMGDNVNLAARMESGAKSWGVYTMCSEATKTACEKEGGDRVVFRPLGRIVVKGRHAAVSIYEIAGLKENVTEQIRECIRIFSQGLDKFYARDWAGATALFTQSLPLEPNQPGVTPGVSSNPSLVYLDIVRHYQAEPPPADWDGVYVMKEK